MRRADRLFKLVQHLRARRLTTARQLAEWLQVSERTVYRDIRDVSLAGIPVQGEAGVGYRLDRSFELTPLMFTRDEVEAAVVGLRMAEAFGGPALRTAARAALAKITLALPEGRRGEVEQTQLYAPLWNVHRATDEHLELIRQAIAGCQKLHVQYADKQQGETRRVLRPLALHFWGASWTLAAWCELRNGFRTFRLDRFLECAPSGDTFAAEPGKSLEDYLRAATND